MSKYLSDQRLAYEICKGFINLNTKKMNDLDRNRAVDRGGVGHGTVVGEWMGGDGGGEGLCLGYIIN